MATFNRVDSIILLSDSFRDQLWFLSRPEHKLHVVPNGTSCDLELGGVTGKELDPTKPIRLLFLSNMIETKGYLDLLEACRVLSFERGLSVHCDFAGEFTATAEEPAITRRHRPDDRFHQRIRDYGLQYAVHYQGVITGTAKQHLLEEAHLLILPTYYRWEGQPLCINEALAFGIPVIATRFRAIPEQVIDRYNGFLIEARNPQQIADCVEIVRNDPDLYHQMSLNAIKHFQQNFTQKAHLGRLIPIILGSASDA